MFFCPQNHTAVILMLTNTLHLGGAACQLQPNHQHPKREMFVGSRGRAAASGPTIGPVDLQMRRLQTGGVFHTRSPSAGPVVCHVRDRTYSYKEALLTRTPASRSPCSPLPISLFQACRFQKVRNNLSSGHDALRHGCRQPNPPSHQCRLEATAMVKLFR